MLNHEYPPIGGGGGYAGRNILREFAGRDDVVVDAVLSRPEPGTVIEKFSDNITLYRVGVKKNALQFWTRLEMLKWIYNAYRKHKQLVSENQYDLAHAFFGFPTAVLTWRTAVKLPYIISLRGSDVPGINVRFSVDYKVLSPLFRRIWQNASGLYACSNGLRQRALKFMPQAEIGVVPNGVEPDRFQPVENNCDPENLRLLTVGRLSVSKRIELLISSLRQLRKQFPNATLTIAGGGGLEKQLRQLILDENMQHCVKMLGIVPSDKMPQLYNNHDIFVTATAQEGMSNAMLEAMASGLPIVTTFCEGVEELIEDNGIVVERPGGQELTTAVKKIVDDSQLYNKMALAARSRAEKFSWHKVAEQYLQIYEQVIHQRFTPGRETTEKL